MSNSKPNFTRIRKFILQCNATFGIFLFRDPSVQKTGLEKLLSLIWPTQAIVLVLVLITTLFVTNFALISIILFGAIVCCVGFLYFTLTKMIWDKEILISFLKWCEHLYDIENKFPDVIQEMAETHLISMEMRIFKMLKWLRNILYVNSSFVTLGVTIVGMFLPERIYPKFTLPVCFYLPFKEQHSWHAFITTVLVETGIGVTCAILSNIIFGLFFCISSHILGFLDLIKEVVAKMRQKMLIKFDESKSSLEPKTLAIIIEKSDNKQKDEGETTFNEWIKIITEMLCDVNSMVSMFSNFYTEFFLLLEIASFGALFFCGLTFTVIREQYVMAIGMLYFTILLFCKCYINEQILDRFDDIKEVLYDTPWYELEIKDRKMLLIAMNCDQIQGGFTAAGIHGLSMERFGIVLKAGYSNLLVLKDLIQK